MHKQFIVKSICTWKITNSCPINLDEIYLNNQLCHGIIDFLYLISTSYSVFMHYW